MSKPSKKIADINALEELRKEYLDKQMSNHACINGITLSIERLQALDMKEQVIRVK